MGDQKWQEPTRKALVGKVVEIYGDGLDILSLPDRSPIANVAPETSAAYGFFPIDGKTLRYIRQMGRDETRIAMVESYAKENGFLRDAGYAQIYTDVLALKPNRTTRVKTY